MKGIRNNGLLTNIHNIQKHFSENVAAVVLFRNYHIGDDTKIIFCNGYLIDNEFKTDA